MSKADDLRKKMEQRSTATFTPRPSVNVQPLPQITEPKPKTEPKTVKLTTPKKTLKPVVEKAKPEAQSDTAELVALFAKVPKEDKRWLDHRRVDTGDDLGVLVSQAIKLLRKQVGD